MLVFDEGPDVGLGHRRRMEALAAGLMAGGTRVALLGPVDEADADIIVVDSYAMRADDPRRFRGRVVVAVDDLDRDLRVDLVVVPGGPPVATRRRCRGRVVSGFEHALVDPSIAAVEARAVDETVAVVLVTTGAADQTGLGAELAAKLAAALPSTETRLVVGPWGSDRLPTGVRPIRVANGLASHLAVADLVVTAGGVTMLEALALGRPTVAVVVAENQAGAVAAAVGAGAVVAASVDTAAAVARLVAGDVEYRRALSWSARRLVDGRGAWRVAEAIIEVAGGRR